MQAMSGRAGVKNSNPLGLGGREQVAIGASKNWHVIPSRSSHGEIARQLDSVKRGEAMPIKQLACEVQNRFSDHLPDELALKMPLE